VGTGTNRPERLWCASRAKIEGARVRMVDSVSAVVVMVPLLGSLSFATVDTYTITISYYAVND
jgi:hypothetical protein